MSKSVLIMDGEAIARALRRIAHEILEHNSEPTKFALVGIPSRGVELARRLAGIIGDIEGKRPELGTIDVAMHRDDLRLRRNLQCLANQVAKSADAFILSTCSRGVE